MAIGSGTPYNVHTGNGVTTTFAYGFTVLAAADLVATVDGVVTSVTVNNVGVAAGGTVLFSVAPANGAEVILRRVLTLVRLVEYQTNGDLLAETINADLNRLLMLIQGVNADTARSIRAPFPETMTELADAADRALKYLGFDADGNPTLLTASAGTALALAAQLINTALVTEGDAMMGVKHTRVGAAARTQHSKNEETVSLWDFDPALSAGGDAQAALAAAIASGAGTIRVPRAAAHYTTSASLALLSNQTLELEEGAEIRSNFDGYVFNTLGSVGAAVSSATAAITVLVPLLQMTSAAGLAAKDMLLLHDVGTDQYEINAVSYIVGNDVFLYWPPSRGMATAADIRVYVVTPKENCRIKGGKISNTHNTGGGILFQRSRNCEVSGVTLDGCGYLGIAAVESIGACFRENTVNSNGKTVAGGSALSLRVTKDCRIVDNRVFDNRFDEPITLFKGNSHALVAGNVLVQQMRSGAGVGGNAILLDDNNYYNVITGNVCEGSPTILVYLFLKSSFNVVTNNVLNRALLGCIKIQNDSNYNVVDGNICSNVANALTNAVEVTNDCVGNVIAPNNRFYQNAATNLLDSQVSAAPGLGSSIALTRNVRVESRDYVLATTGTVLSFKLGADTGNTYGLLTAGHTGDSVEADIVVNPTGVGKFGIGTASPTALMDVNSNTFRLRSSRTPASAAAAGNAGDICWDASYIYVCVATNTWRRGSIVSW